MSIQAKLLATLYLCAATILGTTVAHASSASVCPADNSHTTGAALQAILDYKKSSHQIMAAYFRSWRDIASDPSVNKTSMADLPDCLDIAFVFPNGSEGAGFWSALNGYVTTLHGRGTKVVRTVGLGTLLSDSYSNDAAGYAAEAQHLLSTYVTPYGLDGLDVDVEQELSTAQVQQISGVFKALAQTLGPKSGTANLLIYDTNLDGNEPLFGAVNNLISYVLIQSYGRSVSGLQGTFNTYKPFVSSGQYLIGFSFYEENGTYWGDVSSPLNTSRAYKYAQWQPTQGTKGGIFSYAVDRDGVAQGNNNIVPTNYGVTRALISVMNP